MTVVVLHNPRSGRGQGPRLAARFEHTLHKAGHAVKSLSVGGPEPLDVSKLASATALVIIGGDGTVNHAAQTAGKADTPIYHVGTGNENLFARAFSMTKDPRDLLAALKGPRTAAIDTGTLTFNSQTPPRTFLLMASVGPDASVIRRLAQSRDQARSQTRTRATGHLAYVRPVIRELLAPYLPRLTIEVDSKPLATDTRGLVVVGNIRHYAVGINPTPHACPHDGLLDVTFYPCSTTARACSWTLSAWARRAHRAGASRTAQGHRVTIRTHDASPITQLDGEWITNAANSQTPEPIDITVEPNALRVLLPANA